MSDRPRDGNEIQRERAESRLRSMALDEVAGALEQIGIDIRSMEGRRELRSRLDYLDRLFDMQDTNREALDWARKMMVLSPSPQAIFTWATDKMTAERINREAARKTIVEKTTGGLILLLLGGFAAWVIMIAAKGHFP